LGSDKSGALENMAFHKVESWTIDARGRVDVRPRLAFTSIMDKIVRCISATPARRLEAFVGTVAVHLALLLFLLFKLSDVGPGPGKGSAETLTFVDIGHAESAEQRAAADQAQAQPVAKQASKVDGSTAAVPVEWSVSKIRAPVLIAAPAVTSPQPAASSSAQGSAAGGGGYDPYAGASPRWLPPSPGSAGSMQRAAAAAPTMSASEIRPDLLRALRDLCERANIAVPARMMLTLDAKHRVIEIEAPEFLRSDDVRSAARKAFLGKNPFKDRNRMPLFSRAPSQAKIVVAI